MDDFDTANRRLRLAELIAKYESRAEFVQLFGLSDSYMYQLLHSKAPFGEKAARTLERKAKLPRKYFEQLPETQKIPYESEGASAAGLRLAQRAAELAKSGKLNNEKAQMLLDLMNALTDAGHANKPDDLNKAA